MSTIFFKDFTQYKTNNINNKIFSTNLVLFIFLHIKKLLFIFPNKFFSISLTKTFHQNFYNSQQSVTTTKNCQLS